MQILKIIKNKVLLYLATRYITYGLQFVIGLVVADKLGAYYLGVYGFIQLILMYFTNINFGINNSLNILLVHHKEDNEICERYIATSLIIIGWMSLVVIMIYATSLFVSPSSFERYHADKYFFWICVIAILQYLNNIFMTVMRVRNKLNLVTFMQSFNVLLNFFCIFLFSGQALITSLVCCLLISNTTYIILAYRNGIVPKKKYFSNEHALQREILMKGFYLFVYNSCFYFIIISIRTIISKYYTVEEFGIFTFSYSLGNALMLLSGALSFVVFSKLIDRLSSTDMGVVDRTLYDISASYVTSCHLLIYVALPLFPLIITFLPKYASGITAMNLIALTVIVTTNTMGYGMLLMGRGKERTLAMVSLLSLLLNIALALVLVNVLYVSFTHVIIATTVTYILFTLMVVIFALRSIGGRLDIVHIANATFPIRLFIPYIIALSLALLDKETLIWLPLLVFILINHREIKLLFGKYIKKIIIKPDFVDLK